MFQRPITHSFIIPLARVCLAYFLSMDTSVWLPELGQFVICTCGRFSLREMNI